MSISDDVDWDAFQNLLANAFAVQEGGLDTPSRSALIEIQRFVTSDACEWEQAMHLIAERALAVASASGVAIGLLSASKHELVYRAGSGSAANDVGRRVPAVLSVSSSHETRREILRVENADADPRVEAEICRQFGARSLLMLPIYKEHALGGVVQVLFNDAHTFPENEVRAYRLIVAALEEGMLRSEQAQKQQAEQAMKQMRDEPAVSPVRQPSTEMAIVEPSRDELVLSMDPESRMFQQTYEAIPVRRLSALWTAYAGTLRTIGTRAWSGNLPRAWAVLAAIVFLSMSLWILRHGHFSDAGIGATNSARSDVKFQAPDPALLVKPDPKGLADQPTEGVSLNPGFKRVRVGPNEVDYISDDVTIRTFESRSSKPQIRSAHKVDFGDDVTVHYYMKAPEAASKSPTALDVRATPN